MPKGWAAMLRGQFDFAVDTRSKPLGAEISDSRPFGSAQGRLFAKNAKDGAPYCVGDASEIKSLGHPPINQASAQAGQCNRKNCGAPGWRPTY